MAFRFFTRKSITSPLTRSSRIVFSGFSRPTTGSVSPPAIGTARIVSARVRVHYSWVTQHVTPRTGEPFPPSWLKLPSGPDVELPSRKEFLSEIRSHFMGKVRMLRYLKIPQDLKSASRPPHFGSAINVDSWIVDDGFSTIQVGITGRSPDGKLIFALHAEFDFDAIVPESFTDPLESLDINYVETAGLSFATVVADDNDIVDGLFLTDSKYANGLLSLNDDNMFGSPSAFFFGVSSKFIWLNGEKFGRVAHVKGKSNGVADLLSKMPKKKMNDERVFKIARRDQLPFKAIYSEKLKLTEDQNIQEGKNFKRLVRLMLLCLRKCLRK